MKKLILLLAIAGFFMQAQAQKLVAKDVPAAVTAAFYTANPTIKDVEWSKNGINYVAGYDAEKAEISITYDASGKLINTKMKIVTSALPAPVMEYVKTNYKEDEVKKAFKITDEDGTVTYETKVKDMFLFFDSKGTFINAVKD